MFFRANLTPAVILSAMISALDDSSRRFAQGRNKMRAAKAAAACSDMFLYLLSSCLSPFSQRPRPRRGGDP